MDEPHLANRDGLLNGNFTAPGSIGGQTGTIAYVFPIEGLVVGAGLWSTRGLGSAGAAPASGGTLVQPVDEDKNPVGDPVYIGRTAARDASIWSNNGLIVYGGAAYTMPDLLRVNFSGWMGHEIGEAHAGLQLFAIDGIPINTGFSFYNLHDFEDSGIIQGVVTVGLNNLVDNMALGLGSVFGISQSDAHKDAAFGAGTWVTYTMGNIVPRLDLWLFSGMSYNYNACHAGWGLVDQTRLTFNSDQMFLHIRPTVQFRASSAAWFEIGCIINLELGDVGAAGGTKDDIASFAAFTGVRVTF